MKKTTDYLFTVTSGIKEKCSDINKNDKECSPENCLKCPNAKVKIIRYEDGIVLREE